MCEGKIDLLEMENIDAIFRGKTICLKITTCNYFIFSLLLCDIIPGSLLSNTVGIPTGFTHERSYYLYFIFHCNRKILTFKELQKKSDIMCTLSVIIFHQFIEHI